MTIQETIVADMRKLISKDSDLSKLNTLRYIVGEFSREPNKDVPDNRAIAIIKKAVGSEKEIDGSERFIEVLEGYLPLEATDEDIKKWIESNVDFAKFKNRMQAMKLVMEAFAGRADGNRVKDILNSL